MAAALDSDGLVQYRLPIVTDSDGTANELIDGTVSIRHTGRYFCVRCGRRANKLFGEGFCYPCFRDAPEASECIVRPELCEAHLGRGRDPAWEEEHHNQPHAVYLAVTSAIKVGVTRQVQIPTRWIDQGAASAAQIAAVPYRRLAGLIEVALKEYYTDRTAWQRMLKDERPVEPVDFAAELERCRAALPPDLAEFVVPADQIHPVTINFPVSAAPLKVSSINLAKLGAFSGTLAGIRGQYLIFSDNHVMNVRRHSGFEVELTAE